METLKLELLSVEFKCEVRKLKADWNIVMPDDFLNVNTDILNEEEQYMKIFLNEFDY